MAHDLTQADLETLLPKDVDLRPSIAEQVRKFLKSDDHKGPKDTDIAKAERFLLAVERKGYATKIRKGGGRPTEDSTLYEAMLKNWGRKKKDTEEPDPTGDKKFARGVFYYFFRDVPNHVYFTDIAKQIWKPHELIFKRLYYAKFHDDPKAPSFSKVCARYRAERHIIRREFDRIWIGEPVGVSPKVHLGPVTIVFADEDNLNRLSLQEPADQNYIIDGMPDVFKALDWRSRLSGFHGRRQDVDQLKAWAQDETHKLKIMLVSGPGGVGKTRLAAETVAQLVHEHGWHGGFLGDVSRPIDGNGAGVALIIDYPEERTNLVSEILKAAVQALRNEESYDRPVRLILVSRETREAWDNIINEVATFLDEIELETVPYLEAEDALAIALDIAIEYPLRLHRATCAFSGIEGWLERDDNRLPLNVVAAAVHAVLDPDRAFKLDGAEVLLALAQWELRRVRYYSERDLGDRSSLEKLLSLSLITQLGLNKETIFDLGEMNICVGKSGDSLLEAVRKTPYWRRKTIEHPSHLIRLEPDRVAAIFCLRALLLDDPSPGLPRWLIPAASQNADGFGDRLSRISYDIGHVDPEASRIIEQQSIAMLALRPMLIDQFKGIAYSRSSVFSAAFASEICRRHLQTDLDDSTRASILKNQVAMLSKLGELEMALKTADQAVKIYRKLVRERPDTFWPDLASSLIQQAAALCDCNHPDLALKAIEEAVSICSKLVKAQPNASTSNLASALHTQANIFSALGQRQKALNSVEKAVALDRKRAQLRTNGLQTDLASSLVNKANRLGDLGEHEVALEAIEEAVAIFRQAAPARPDAFQPDLAASLKSMAVILSDLEQEEAALEAIDESVAVYRQLALARPDAFRPLLADALNCLTNRCLLLDELDTALEASEEAVEIYRQLMQARPDAFLSELATSLNNRTGTLSGLERREDALESIDEAIAIYSQLADERPDAFMPSLAAALSNKAGMLFNLGRREAALAVSAHAVRALCPFFIENPMAHMRYMTTIFTEYVRMCDETSTQPDLELVSPILDVFNQLGKY